jgi:hypothetical protein
VIKTRHGNWEKDRGDKEINTTCLNEELPHFCQTL